MSETRAKGKADKGPFAATRKIPLAPAAAEALQNAVRQLTAVDSILDARIDRHGQLRIAYDTSSIGIRDIEAWLERAGIARAAGAGWRLKSAWSASWMRTPVPMRFPREAHAATARLRRMVRVTTQASRDESEA